MQSSVFFFNDRESPNEGDSDNQDGSVDLLGIDPFAITILVSQFCVNSDINRDGIVDLLDVEPFVFLLTIQ